MARPRVYLAAAWACAAAIVASAPLAQQLFMEVSDRWPEESPALGAAATVIPAAMLFVIVWRRIRERRLLRYTFVVLGFALGTAYVFLARLVFTEAFHFIEYGIVAILFYRASIAVDDWSILARPLLAGVIVGSLDEWFQWFVPLRAGEMRDVLINVVATACGLLVAVALHPPDRLRLTLHRASRRAVGRLAAAAVGAFAALFYAVHLGHDVPDPEIGSFRSRFTAAALAEAARDRAGRWPQEPPVVQRRFGREDHYLTEGLWHVRRRNEAWELGDAATAWRENRILEKHFAPVLETPTYLDPAGHRWPPELRAAAAERVGGMTAPIATRDYAYPLYVWPAIF